MYISKKKLWGIVKKAYAKAATEQEIKDSMLYRNITFSWNIEDINFWFTVKVGQGKITLTDKESKNSDITFYNKRVEEFHRANIGELTQRDMLETSGFRYVGHFKYLRHVSILCKHMRVYYKSFA